MKEYIIQPKSGIRIDVDKGQKIEIIDVEGGQVADFLQEMKGIHEEYVKNVYEQAKNMLTYSGLFT